MSQEATIAVVGVGITLLMLLLGGAFYMGWLSQHLASVSQKVDTHISDGAIYRKEVSDRFDRLEKKIDDLIARIGGGSR